MTRVVVLAMLCASCSAPFTQADPSDVLEGAAAPDVLEDVDAGVHRVADAARDFVEAGTYEASDVQPDVADVAADAAAECRASYLATCSADPIACESLSLCNACPGACDQ